MYLNEKKKMLGSRNNEKRARSAAETSDQIAILTLEAEKAQCTTHIATLKQKLKRYEQLTQSHNNRIKELEQMKCNLELKVLSSKEDEEKLKKRDAETKKILLGLRRMKQANTQKLNDAKKNLEKKVYSFTSQRDKDREKKVQIEQLKGKYAEDMAVVNAIDHKERQLERRASEILEEEAFCQHNMEAERAEMEKLKDEFTRTRASTLASQISADVLAAEVAKRQEELKQREGKQHLLSNYSYTPDQMKLMETLQKQIKESVSSVQQKTESIQQRKDFLHRLQKRERRYNHLQTQKYIESFE